LSGVGEILEAFTQLPPHFSADTGMTFVLAQHADTQHESALNQLLSRATKMAVHEVRNKLQCPMRARF
jgi:chemotaxis response regulator CheB